MFVQFAEVIFVQVILRPERGGAMIDERKETEYRRFKKFMALVEDRGMSGFKALLTADPYTVLSEYNFGGLLDEEVFRTRFMFPNEKDREFVNNPTEEDPRNQREICAEGIEKFDSLVNEIKDEFNNNSKSIFYLVGTRGCGKTTFVHELLSKLGGGRIRFFSSN